MMFLPVVFFGLAALSSSLAQLIEQDTTTNATVSIDVSDILTAVSELKSELKSEVKDVKSAIVELKQQLENVTVSCNTKATGRKLPTVQECASGWVKFKNSCFKFMYTMNMGDDARSDCQSMGAELPTVRTREIQDFLMKRMKIQRDVWTGLRGKGGKWTWPDGSSVDSGYSNMAPGQPSRSSGCVNIRTGDNLWRAFHCEEAWAEYACEKDL